MPLIALLLAALAHSAQAYPAKVATGPPRLVGNSSYVSATANQYNIRDRIDVYGHNFIVLAVGNDPNTGAGSHDGGAIFVKEQKQSYTLTGIGIELPKDGVSEWVSGQKRCQRLELSNDVYASVCVAGGRHLNSVVSKSRGVLSFTGWCPVMGVGGGQEICEYVLLSPKGIMAR